MGESDLREDCLRRFTWGRLMKGGLSTLRLGREPEWPEPALLDAFILAPGIIPGEVDVVPMDRRHMLE